ncbi:hypothetical protein JW756_00625 [Candidatus Woesearchaeota archaeon]|nr:hypothetical protein [Candidatus Woesearchaeota archaeon]
MGLFGSARNRMADIGGYGRQAGIRFSNNVFGFFSGGESYNSLRNRIQSIYAREMLDTKITKRSLRKMHRISLHLAAFSEDRLSNIYRRYSDDPKNFQKFSDKMVQKFTSDLNNFVSEYSLFLKAINDELINEMRQMSDQEKALADMINRLYKVCRDNRIYLPAGMIEQLEAEMEKFSRKAMRATKVSIEDDFREEKHSVIVRGLNRIPGWLGHKLKKLYGRRRKKDLKDFKENLSAINTQLNSGNVEPGILTRFLKYIKSSEKAERLHKLIEHDLKMLLQDSEENVNATVKSIELFMAMFKKAPGVQRLFEVYSNLKREHNNLYVLLKSDEANENMFWKQILDTDKSFLAFLEDLKRFSRSLRDTLNADDFGFQRLNAKLAT